MVMKAYARQGARSSAVALVGVPIPEVGDHEVLVEVRAFGVGVHDRYFIPATATFPYPIGTEAAGVIAATGRSVTTFKVGEAVVLTNVLSPKGGPWAPFAVAPEQTLIRLPEKMSFVEAAAIPIAGNAALESMKSLALKRGESLFIAGASGAIGTLLIQMAAARGIRVAGSASPKNHDHMHALGAELAVDYADPDWPLKVRAWMPEGVDAALAIQPGTGQGCVTVVRTGGRVVTVSGDNASVVPERGIRVEQMMHHPETRQELIQLISDIAEGRVRLVIERVYPFEQALDALSKTETRHARGKLVVSLEQEA